MEETVKRLSSHKGVLGIVILNADAVPIRSTLDNELAVQYAALVSQITIKARSMVRELAAEDDLQFLRLRSKKHEIMVAPSFDKEHQYSLVVVQVSHGHSLVSDKCTWHCLMFSPITTRTQPLTEYTSCGFTNSILMQPKIIAMIIRSAGNTGEASNRSCNKAEVVVAAVASAV